MMYIMQNFFKKNNRSTSPSRRGFVLVYTLFVCAIMLLISTSISVSLVKQIYFSRLSRQSETAYFAADSAIMCTIDIDDTYVDQNGFGIFPHDPTSVDPSADVQAVLDHINEVRAARSLDTLSSLNDIVCARSTIFDPVANDFAIATTTFTRTTTEAPFFEDGKTSTFTMKMDTGDGNYRCAKVTVNKTETYRQIIAQGYATCDLTGGAIERAIVNVTLNN